MIAWMLAVALSPAHADDAQKSALCMQSMHELMKFKEKAQIKVTTAVDSRSCRSSMNDVIRVTPRTDPECQSLAFEDASPELQQAILESGPYDERKPNPRLAVSSTFGQIKGYVRNMMKAKCDGKADGERARRAGGGQGGPTLHRPPAVVTGTGSGSSGTAR